MCGDADAVLLPRVLWTLTLRRLGVYVVIGSSLEMPWSKSAAEVAAFRYLPKSCEALLRELNVDFSERENSMCSMNGALRISSDNGIDSRLNRGRSPVTFAPVSSDLV